MERRSLVPSVSGVCAGDNGEFASNSGDSTGDGTAGDSSVESNGLLRCVRSAYSFEQGQNSWDDMRLSLP